MKLNEYKTQTRIKKKNGFSGSKYVYWSLSKREVGSYAHVIIATLFYSEKLY